MRFLNAAKAFDKTPVYNAYTSRALYKGQMGAFETSNSEGSIAKRRVFSLAPGLAIPARRCISWLDEIWIVGAGSADGFASAIRQSFWVRKSSESLTIRTPSQVVLASGGTAAYAQLEYLKDTVNSTSDADYDPQYEIFFASDETLSKGYFLVGSSGIYRVRSVYLHLAGFNTAVSDKLDISAPATATFTTGAYVPATDTYSSASTAVSSLEIDRSKLYSLKTEADESYKAGDKTLLVSKTQITPTVGQELTYDSLPWRVQQVTSEQDAWALHIRRR